MLFAAILFTGLFTTNAFAQDSARKETTFYTFVFNQVPEHFNYPLIGLVNMAEGNQHGVQVGFTNINQKNINGTQVGFTNVVSGATNGMQVGFVNAGKDSLKGAQVGYINLLTDKVNGAQVGFINAAKKSVDGAQVGFINVASQEVDGMQVAFVNANIGATNGAQVGYVNVSSKDIKGAQVGFVNHANQKLTGTQVGFVNTAIKESKGTQVGFVNVSAHNLKGSQIGFINVVDSISGGVPLGFLSIIRKGGYYALEAGANELYPANLSFKIGMRQLYTSFQSSYNPDFKNEFALGAGIGSLLQLSNRLYFNPEAMIQHTIDKNTHMFVSLATNLGFAVSDHWSVVAGPSVTWSHLDNDNTETVSYKPAFSLYKNTIDTRNRIHVGARFAIRYNF